MVHPRRKFLLIIWIAWIVAACAPGRETSPGSEWKYEDLRVLSPGDLEIPEYDLIAAYSRIAGEDLQIRLDLLDLTSQSNFDMYIALDTTPGGSNALPLDVSASVNWDTLLILPGFGTPKAISATDINEAHPIDELALSGPGELRVIPRISRIHWLDTVIVSVNKNKLPISLRGINIQVFLAPPESNKLADSIGPFRSDGAPPPRAPLMLAFWNTFSAYSPAQAIRRWDGAHTGPFGERHGLSVLLHAVRRTRVPITLLDLKQPISVSALDYLAVLPLVRELVDDKLLILPDPLPGSPSYPVFPQGLPDWATDQALEDVRSIAQEFNLPASNILYSPRRISGGFDQYEFIFTEIFTEDLGRSSNRLLPIPYERPTEPLADADGLSLQVRKRLLDNALKIAIQDDTLPLLILGGSLRSSPFGDPEVASNSLNYIAVHPWLDPITIDDLASRSPAYQPQVMPGVNFVPNIGAFSPSPVLSILEDPGEEGANELAEAAWQSALAIYYQNPPEPFNLTALRSIYSSQVIVLLHASLWAENHLPLDTCRIDPDQDDIPECILASENVYIATGIDGGRILSMFVRTESGVHQVIAPTTQFLIGIGDPSTWNLDAGEGADPGGIHGAFADSQPPWDYYIPNQNSNGITLTPTDPRKAKTITLTESGIRVEYQNLDPVTAQIPIALDPWLRFTDSWGDKYIGEILADGYRWRLVNGPTVEIHSNAKMRPNPFTASRPKLSGPEDPNFNYPRGHFLPFPILLVDLNRGEDFFVEISVTD
jgi:hypothetical protein